MQSNPRPCMQVVLKRSTDGGASWSPLMVVHDDWARGAVSIGNAAAVSTGNNILLLLNRDNVQTLLLTSRSVPSTHIAPYLPSLPHSLPTSPTPLLPYSRTLSLYHPLSLPPSSTPSFTLCLNASDDGVTWSAPRDVTNTTCCGGPGKFGGVGPPGGVQLPSGRLLFCGYELGESFAFWSDDEGANWAKGSAVGKPGSSECQVSHRSGISFPFLVS